MVYFHGSGIFSDFAKTMGSSVPVVIVAFGEDLKKISIFISAQYSTMSAISIHVLENLNVVNAVQLFS